MPFIGPVAVCPALDAHFEGAGLLSAGPRASQPPQSSPQPFQLADIRQAIEGANVDHESRIAPQLRQRLAEPRPILRPRQPVTSPRRLEHRPAVEGFEPPSSIPLRPVDHADLVEPGHRRQPPQLVPPRPVCPAT